MRKRTRPDFAGDTLRRRFCLRLHDLADKAGVSYIEIAKACGTSKTAVAKWFSGRSVPKLDDWQGLANAIAGGDIRRLVPPA